MSKVKSRNLETSKKSLSGPGESMVARVEALAKDRSR